MPNILNKNPGIENDYSLEVIEIVQGDTLSKIMVEFEGADATGWATPLLDVQKNDGTVLTKNGVIETANPALFTWAFSTSDFDLTTGDLQAQVRLTDDNGNVKKKLFILRVLESLV